MTVNELISRLQQEDPDAQVHFAYNARDHWRTMLAPKVQHVETMPVVHDAYHNAPAVSENETDYETENLVVVLK